MRGKNLKTFFCFNIFTSIQKKFPNWAPPACDPDTHACKLADDGCSFSCIRQDECTVRKLETSIIRLTKFKDKIEITAFGSGYVCNCVKHDPERYEFVWSCDNKGVNATESDTNHQYG